MDSALMFATALGLKEPWYIESVGFEKPNETIDNRGRVKREASANKAATSDSSDKKPVIPHVLSGLNTIGNEFIRFLLRRRRAPGRGCFPHAAGRIGYS